MGARMEVIILRFDPDQLQQILNAVSATQESGHVASLVRNLYRFVVAEDGNIKQEIQRMSAELDAVVAAAHANTDVVNSAIATLNSLVALVQDHINDPVALQAVLDEIKASDQALGDAIAAVPAPTPAPPGP